MNVNITCQLLGGLGNMLFGAATTYAIGLDNNLTPVLHINHKGMLHTHPIDYINNIFNFCIFFSMFIFCSSFFIRFIVFVK